MKELAAQMKVLSDAYAAQLPGKFAQLDEMWNKLPRDAWDEEGFQVLHRMVHSMTGSGRTFGFAALSDVARGLENYLKLVAQEKTAPDETQRNHIQSMMAALRQVAIERDEHHEAQSGSAAVVHGEREPRSRRIMVVEDEVALAEKLRSQLSYFGFDVTAYNRLEDFRRAFAQNDDAVVIMDISFPEDSWGGVHVMKEIQQGRKIPVPTIFLTGHEEFEARLEAVRAGGIAYFNKGVNISALIDKLDELTSSRALAPYRVLIVDDEPSLTAYFSAVLQQAGMETLAINNPLMVIEPLLEFEPDMIMMDMYMPGCSGLELAKVIRQLEAFVSIPIVFLSAEKDLDKQLAALNFGVDDFLTKPIQPQHLVAAVSSRIRRSMLLRSFMVRDSLTGLLNHTAIKDQLDREVARAKRSGTSCSFAMVDIDHFKKVNDSYGHSAGDRVIKSLSRLLKQRLRENDAIGRYGGEEFAVILADVDGAAAVQVMDTIREDFSRLHHLADGHEFEVTISCGIADVSGFADATLLGDAADRALYQAKRAGRNQVILA